MYKMRGWWSLGNNVWPLLEKYGEVDRDHTNLVFCSGYNAYTFLKSTEEVFYVQGAWHSVNMLLTMVHDQTVRIHIWQTQ